MRFSLTHLPILVTVLAGVLLVTSCLDDDDDSPRYATNADFGMLYTDASAQVVAFTTDDDAYRIFNDPVTATGAMPDTTYRALIYYVAESNTATYVDYYYFEQVPVLAPIDSIAFDQEIITDPIYSFDELWVSNNNSYINILISVYTSQDNQTLDFISTYDSERGVTKLTLYHTQPDIYGFYTTSTYLSIPIQGYFSPGETVEINTTTYSGVVTKTVTIPRYY